MNAANLSVNDTTSVSSNATMPKNVFTTNGMSSNSSASLPDFPVFRYQVLPERESGITN